MTNPPRLAAFIKARLSDVITTVLFTIITCFFWFLLSVHRHLLPVPPPPGFWAFFFLSLFLPFVLVISYAENVVASPDYFYSSWLSKVMLKCYFYLLYSFIHLIFSCSLLLFLLIWRFALFENVTCIFPLSLSSPPYPPAPAVSEVVAYILSTIC